MNLAQTRSAVIGVLISIAGIASTSPLASAQEFLSDAQHMFFDQSMLSRRFGIEIEFSGVTDEIAEQIIIEKMQATVAERLPTGELVFSSPYGEVRLKIEGQAWRYELDPARFERQVAHDKIHAPREVVFPPMTFKDVQAIQDVGIALRDHGAVGTTDTQAVSTQVNVEMPLLVKDGVENPKAIEDFLNLMRVYSDPEHYAQIEAKIHVPAIRREYIKDFSPGFLKRIENKNYKPTARQLFDDYFYRQSLEVLGIKGAWTMELETAKKTMMAQPDPVVPLVAKMLRMRPSSLLLLAFPEDPLAKAIIATRWARAMPIVEFREHNTDFDIRTTIEQCLGIVRSVEVFGDYDHDTLVSKLTGIDARDLVELRKNTQILKGAPRVVRYALQDPKTAYIKNQNKGSNGDYVWIQLDPDKVGERPLVVAGNSVVFNRRGIHRQTLLGKYNPGLENVLIQQAMENKILESKLLRKYVKGSMARALTLPEVTDGRSVNLDTLLEKLNIEFPNGWVMKGAWDLATENLFISDKLNIPELLDAYRNGFETFRAKVEKKYKGADPEEILTALKEHEGYRGWKIVQLLANPETVFFQERVRIVKEFRVEVQGGKVLSKGSTIDRYAYKKNPEDKSDITPEQISGAEAFAQNLIDELPDAMRFLPYGFDVALIENGTWKLIETNPGGNSSFLEENTASIEALDEYLGRYPDLVDRGKIKLLTPEEQISWLKKEFADLRINPVTLYTGMTFTPNDIIDPLYPRVALPKTICERLLLAK